MSSSENDESRKTGATTNQDQRNQVLPDSSALVVLLILFGLLTVVVLAVILAEPSGEPDHQSSGQVAYGPADFPEIDFNEPLLDSVKDPGGDDTETIRVSPPPFSEDIFPCSECHSEMEVNREPRQLEDFHDDIILDHGPADRWCLDCHNADDRDVLRLVNGTLIPFDESYRLCGQCHGTIFRDWRNGIHGQRRGYWNGRKSLLLCAHCHNPHSPRFQAIKPLPPPVRPEFLGTQNDVPASAEENHDD